MKAKEMIKTGLRLQALGLQLQLFADDMLDEDDFSNNFSRDADDIRREINEINRALEPHYEE